jgi:hypothetical protein
MVLIERRCYTLKTGSLSAFWRAQNDRGYESVRPILDRLIGYFSAVSGPADQVVHLYRYDDFDDWQSRLHGLYAVPGLEPYFKTVRALMTSQANAFLKPAPLDALSPIWNGSRDWLPAHGPIFGGAQGTQMLVEESTHLLVPGSLPAYWAAWADAGVSAMQADAASQLGSFVSVVGRQHEVRHYRVHASFEARQVDNSALTSDARWKKFIDAIAPICFLAERKLLLPAAMAPLSPLFMQEQ